MIVNHRACREIGVSEHDLFETVDLYEEKDLNVVVQCIFALGRTVQARVPEYTGPVLGPRMAVANKREFTAEQLAKSRQQDGMTKIMAGSVNTMDRSEVSTAGNVTFGAEKSGMGDSSSISALNQGSVNTMDRTYVSTSGSVTFGAEKSGVGHSSSVSAANQGSVNTMERTHISSSGNITFGHDMGKR